MSTQDAAEVAALATLLPFQTGSIASRVLMRSAGGTVTLFAIAAGEGLSEHTTPFEAMALVLEGQLDLTIGGRAFHAGGGDVVRLPAAVPHALTAQAPTRMLLIMIKEPREAGR